MSAARETGRPPPQSAVHKSQNQLRCERWQSEKNTRHEDHMDAAAESSGLPPCDNAPNYGALLDTCLSNLYPRRHADHHSDDPTAAPPHTR